MGNDGRDCRLRLSKSKPLATVLDHGATLLVPERKQNDTPSTVHPTFTIPTNYFVLLSFICDQSCQHNFT